MGPNHRLSLNKEPEYPAKAHLCFRRSFLQRLTILPVSTHPTSRGSSPCRMRVPVKAHVSSRRYSPFFPQRLTQSAAKPQPASLWRKSKVLTVLSCLLLQPLKACAAHTQKESHFRQNTEAVVPANPHHSSMKAGSSPEETLDHWHISKVLMLPAKAHHSE